MGVFIQILLLIIQYGPTIWKLVQEIINMINGVSEYLPSSESHCFKIARRQELKAAVAHYRATKSQEKLELMHGELSCQLSNLRNR